MKALNEFSSKSVLIIILMTPPNNSSSDDSKTDDYSNGITPIDNKNIVTIIVTDGTLKVTYYWNSDLNETINFDGYSFTFRANNLLTATDGKNTYNGTWSITNTNSYIDDLSDVKFDINFTSTANLMETIDHWAAINPSYIPLNDLICGSSEAEFSTFSKN